MDEECNREGKITMKWAVVVMEYTSGDPYEVIGPFDSKDMAVEWIDKNRKDHILYEVVPMKEPAI